jgi:hypothetical protein
MRFREFADNRFHDLGEDLRDDEFGGRAHRG